MQFLFSIVELIGQFLQSENQVLFLLVQTGYLVILLSDCLLHIAQRCTMIIGIVDMLLQFLPKSFPIRLHLIQLLLDLFIATFGNLDSGTQSDHHRLQALIFLFLHTQLLHQVVLLAPHILITKNERIFKLLGHVLHLPSHTPRLIHLLLQLTEQFLVSRTDLLKLVQQHLLLAHPLLSLPFVKKQLLLVASILLHETLILFKEMGYILTRNDRLDPVLRHFLIKQLQLLQLGTQD